MKVIFLDVDGVLNCKYTTSKCGFFIGIDNSKVNFLWDIIEATSAKIVLCSSWKDGWYKTNKEDQDESANYLDRKLKRRNLFIMDKTSDKGENRGAGIKKWMLSHKVDKFIILDDEMFDYVEEGLDSRVIKTSFYDRNGGLQEIHVEQAIAMLNEDK